jgi:hypothetical protein
VVLLNAARRVTYAKPVCAVLLLPITQQQVSSSLRLGLQSLGKLNHPFVIEGEDVEKVLPTLCEECTGSTHGTSPLTSLLAKLRKLSNGERPP